MEVFMNFWNEYGAMILGIGGTIITIGGIILTAYLKFKPILDDFKAKLSAVKDKVTDADAQSIADKLQMIDIDKKITDLEEKIANPLTSESARESYTKQLKATVEIRALLEAGVAKAEDTNNRF